MQTSQPGDPPFSMVMSSGRLQALMKAEMGYLENTYTVITVEKVLEQCTPYKVARVIKRELPARFATRLREIEAVPQWRTISGLIDVHSMLIESFYNIRLVHLDEHHMLPFIDVIRDLRRRHRPVLQHLTQAAREMTDKQVMTNEEVSAWLEQFMTSRIGTEMLTAQFVSLLEHPGGVHFGIVDHRCDPTALCQKVIDQVLRNALANYSEKEVPKIRLVSKHKDIRFSFIPSYLANMIDELLKNSVMATILLRRKLRSAPPGAIRGRSIKGGDIEVTVSADHDQVGIRISDAAGGVPFADSERVWDYMFSTMPEDMQTHFREETPLSGPGLGLPLVKLYATYLKGSLEFMSVPGVGTDAYLFLSRLDAAEGCVEEE